MDLRLPRSDWRSRVFVLVEGRRLKITRDFYSWGNSRAINSVRVTHTFPFILAYVLRFVIPD